MLALCVCEAVTVCELVADTVGDCVLLRVPLLDRVGAALPEPVGVVVGACVGVIVRVRPDVTVWVGELDPLGVPVCERVPEGEGVPVSDVV